MRIHCIQHVFFEDPGYIEPWAKSRHHTFITTIPCNNEPFPDIDNFDMLVIMGGPMGVYDEEEYQWLKAEKQFIKSAIVSGKLILGVCLGAQLIADALGAEVYPNTEKEIGWFPVALTCVGESEELLDGLPSSFIALHWHGDTFDIPPGSKHLMQSEACRNQAFIFNNNVLGLQFHLETTPEGLSALVENCQDELVRGKYIQPESEIVCNEHFCEIAHKLLRKILDDFTN